MSDSVIRENITMQVNMDYENTTYKYYTRSMKTPVNYLQWRFANVEVFSNKLTHLDIAYNIQMRKKLHKVNFDLADILSIRNWVI